MIPSAKRVYEIRFVFSDGRESVPSLLFGNIVLGCILDYVEENDIQAILSLHKREYTREDENRFSNNNTQARKYTKKTFIDTLHTKKENAAIKNDLVSETEKTIMDELKGNVKSVTTNSTNRGSTAITIWIVCLYSFMNVGNAMSCKASLESMKSTRSCPTNDEEWKIAVSQMKCSQIQQSCCSPEDFEYHCLVSAFGNETVEVCAPRKRINYCVEFNSLGARIQANFRMKCTNSTIDCGKFYNSTDMYKMPQCVSLWRKTANTTPSETTKASPLHSSITTKANFRLTSTMHDEISKEQTIYKVSRNTSQIKSSLIYLLFVILGIVGFVLLIIAAYMFIWKKRCKEIQELKVTIINNYKNGEKKKFLPNVKE